MSTEKTCASMFIAVLLIIVGKQVFISGRMDEQIVARSHHGILPSNTREQATDIHTT